MIDLKRRKEKDICLLDKRSLKFETTSDLRSWALMLYLDIFYKLILPSYKLYELINASAHAHDDIIQ